MALVVTTVFWASAFAGIRAGLEAYGPGQVALFRFLVASAALAGYATLTRMRLPERRDLPAVFLGGLLAFAVYHVALNYGEVTVSAGSASILIATAPVFTALLAVAFLGERLRVVGWVGMGVSFLGSAMISLGEGEGLSLNARAAPILLAALSTSLYFILQKPYLEKYGALAFTTYAIWAGTLLTLIYLPSLVSQVRTAPTGTTLAIVYLGVFPTAIAFTTYAYALRHMSASNLGITTYLVPPITIVMGLVFLDEAPPAMAYVGGALALVGVAVARRKPRTIAEEAGPPA